MKLTLSKETLSSMTENEVADVVGGKSQGPFDTVCICHKNNGPTYDQAWTCVPTDGFCN